MRSGILVGIALIVIGLARTATWAADDTAGMQSQVIVLKNAQPASVMWALRLLDPEDYMAGRTLLYPSVHTEEYVVSPESGLHSYTERHIETSGSSVSRVTPPEGIKLVAPYGPDNALIIYGDPKFFPAFISKVQELDVVPRQVQVKTEIFRLNVELAKKLKLSNPEELQAQADSSKVITAIRAAVKSGDVKLIASPIVAVTDGSPGLAKISSDSSDISVQILSSIRQDDRIMLYIKLDTKTGTGTQQAHQSIYTTRLIADGESSLVSGVVSDREESQLAVITANIIR
jgi:hypothetical protein